MSAEKNSDRDLNKNSLDKALVVMANTLARKQTQWSVRETKLFLTALSQIKWRTEDNWVVLNKKEVCEMLEMDPNDISKLRNLFQTVATKSWISFEKEDGWEDGFLLTKARGTRTTVSVKFDKDYLPLLDKLEKNFTMFHLKNIAHFKSKHSITLFQRLKSAYNPNIMINHVKWSLDEIKRIFELDENAYMVKRKINDEKYSKVFDIYNFEKNVLKKAMKEINEEPTKSGMYIEEIKKLKTKGDKGFVSGYDIAFSLVREDGTRRYDKLDVIERIKLTDEDKKRIEEYEEQLNIYDFEDVY